MPTAIRLVRDQFSEGLDSTSHTRYSVFSHDAIANAAGTSILEDRIETELERLEDDELHETVEEYLADYSEPAVRAELVEEGRRNLAVSWWGKLLGRTEDTPERSRLRSKYGGLPYLESVDEWPRSEEARRDRFVGQLNFGAFETPANLPERGILVVYERPATPEWNEDAFSGFRVRWYPEPDPDRAASLEWPVPSVEFEIPIELVRAESYRIPETWNQVVPDSIAGRQEYVIDDQLDGVTAAVRETSGTVGGAVDFGLDGPGPRHWVGEVPGDVEEWRELWRPLGGRGRWGSLEASLMIPRRNLERGRLDQSYTLLWQ